LYQILKDMFTTTKHQELMHECMEWDLNLKAMKERINEWRNELYALSPFRQQQEEKMDIEHFHNQFHIQMINLHDLIHEIEQHMSQADEHPENRYKEPHQALKGKYEALVKIIEELEATFKEFAR